MTPDPLHADGVPFDGGAFFSHVAERAPQGLWRLPVGDRLEGPAIMNGECLAPLVLPGDRLWIDRSVKPAHGNLVIVHWCDAVYERLCEFFGYAPERQVVKVLRNPDVNMAPEGIEDRAAAWGSPWPDFLLCQSQGQMFATPNTIIGTVVRIERNGHSLYH